MKLCYIQEQMVYEEKKVTLSEAVRHLGVTPLIRQYTLFDGVDVNTVFAGSPEAV